MEGRRLRPVPAGRWLAPNNYRNAKRFGFIPSYLEDTSKQGREPDPREWTYVGDDTIRCESFHLGYAAGPEAANPGGTVHDLEVCGDLARTREAVAYYLSDVLDLESGADAFVDDDGAAYEDAIRPSPRPESSADATYRRRIGSVRRRMGHARRWPSSSTGLSTGETTDVDHFIGDDGSEFEPAIERMAAAGITQGCNPPADDRFCPRTR